MKQAIRLTTLLLLAAMAAPGCKTAAGEAAAADRPTRSVSNVAPPPGLGDQVVLPREGEELRKAQLSMEAMLATLTPPTYLTASAAPGQESALDSEPPVAAQRAYIAARQAWRQGRSQAFEAIRQLQNALTLAPGHPAILRMLGKIYTATGNPTRGAVYLEQAVAADPSDLESVFLLGRFAFAERKWSDAITTLHHAMKLATQSGADPAMPSIMSYFLGSALEHEGYDAAAIEHFTAYLRESEHLDRATMLVRELGLLSRQRSLTWQTVGDAHHRLDQPAKALRAYEQAMASEPSDVPALVRRLVYTHLRLGQRDQARDLVVAQVRQAESRMDMLPLVPYLTEHGVGAAKLSEELERIYRENDRPTALALAVASLSDQPQALAFLEAHLQARPDDKDVFESIVRRRMKAAGEGAGEHRVAAVRVTAQAIQAQPRVARDYLATLLDAAGDMSHVLDAIASMPQAQQDEPAVCLIRGIAMVQSGRIEEGEAQLERASEAGLDAARVTLIRLLVARREYDRAESLLAELPRDEREDSEIVGLRIKVLTETDRAQEALELVDRALTARPNDVDLVLDKAVLLMRLNRVLESERLLLDALNASPNEERIYEALFALYDPPNDQPSSVPDATRQWQRLMQRLLGSIPHSRLARLKRAEWAIATREYDAAEDLLKSVLAQNLKDIEALDMMLELFEESGRLDEAAKMLDTALEQSPQDRRLLALAAAHYAQRVKDKARAAQYQEQLILLDPPSPLRSLRLGLVYFEVNRFDDALVQLRDALAVEQEPAVRLVVHHIRRCLVRLNRPDEFAPIVAQMVERFPAMERDLLFEHATMLQSVGQWERAEKMLLDLLARDPENPMLNNHLGYTWADRGMNLERAQQMIELAVEAEPDNAAYLDSIGWVHYKLGRFDEALTWLTRARGRPGGDHIVILDHLGDAQYRTNRKDQAVATWRAALAKFNPEEAAEEVEVRGLDERLKAKIQAVTQSQEPDVADAITDQKPAAGQPEQAAAPAEPLEQEAPVAP